MPNPVPKQASYAKARIHEGWVRLQTKWFYILQVAVAAGAAYWAAHVVFGHDIPFLSTPAACLAAFTSGQTWRTIPSGSIVLIKKLEAEKKTEGGIILTSLF